MADTIGEWTTAQLIRFIEDMFRTNPPPLGNNEIAEALTITDDLHLDGYLNFSLEQTGVGAAGGASALPATPLKYFQVKDSAGNVLVIPAYNRR